MKIKLAHIFPYVVIAGLLIYIQSMEKGVEYVTLPPKVNTKVITTPQPVSRGTQEIKVDGVLKVVEIPNPVNDTLLTAYTTALDSLEQLKLYKEAVTERMYHEQLVDSVQTIDVHTSVTGWMREQKITYRTNPVTVERKSLRSPLSVYAGGFVTLPTLPSTYMNVGGMLNIKTKKQLYSVGYDTESKIHLGVGFRLF